MTVKRLEKTARDVQVRAKFLGMTAHREASRGRGTQAVWTFYGPGGALGSVAGEKAAHAWLDGWTAREASYASLSVTVTANE